MKTLSDVEGLEDVMDETLLDSTVDSNVYETADDVEGSEDSEEDADSSFNSASESPPPTRASTVRRSTRTTAPPTVFTYERIGGGGVQGQIIEVPPPRVGAIECRGRHRTPWTPSGRRRGVGEAYDGV